MQCMCLVSKHAKLHKGLCGEITALQDITCTNFNRSATLDFSRRGLFGQDGQSQ